MGVNKTQNSTESKPGGVSEKQAVTNRENALKSTGPVTPEGKAVSSQNAVKFGLYAQDVVIDSKHRKESAEEFAGLMESLYEEFEPESMFQEFLLVKIANSLWRSRRAAAAETAEIRHRLEDVDSDVEYRQNSRDWTGDESVGEIRDYGERYRQYYTGMSLLPSEITSRKILRYEMRLDRQLSRAVRLLRQLKRRTVKKKEAMQGL